MNDFYYVLQHNDGSKYEPHYINVAISDDFEKISGFVRRCYSSNVKITKIRDDHWDVENHGLVIDEIFIKSYEAINGFAGCF